MTAGPGFNSDSQAFTHLTQQGHLPWSTKSSKLTTESLLRSNSSHQSGSPQPEFSQQEVIAIMNCYRLVIILMVSVPMYFRPLLKYPVTVTSA